jgi:hypothetical protein
MRLLPHRIYLMTLQGRKTLHGRPLPSKEEALAGLHRLTGQAFGDDVQKWTDWLRKNWRNCYGPGSRATDSGQRHD